MSVIERQEILDRFYHQHGPCCAGCDWWAHLNAAAGLCTKAAPVAAHERGGPCGIHGLSFNVGAGHPVTPRDYRCGDFVDSFNWSSLSPAYRRRIGRTD